MVMSAAEQARSGTREWIFQRISNLSICLWGVVFILMILSMDQSSFAEWQAVFSPVWFKLYSTLTLILVALNSVLAGWQIGTDYIKPPSMNRVYMMVCIGGTALYFCLGIYILWLV